MKFFNLLSIHIFGLVTYFFFFGILNIITGKIEYSTINTLTIIYIFLVIISFLIINFLINNKEYSYFFLLKLKKLSNFHLIIFFGLSFLIITYYFFKLTNLFLYTTLNHPENKTILEFAKFRHFIIFPILFLLIFTSIYKIFYREKILLYSTLAIIITIFLSFFGRRILATLLFLSLIIILNLIMSKKYFIKNLIKKIIIYSFSFMFLWIIFSNYYLNFRIQSIDNSVSKIFWLFDYKKTINNFSSRPSTFYQFNRIINFNSNELMVEANGKLIFQSLENSVPKIFFKDKKYIPEDLLISNYATNSGQEDLSSNALSLFFVDFGVIGIFIYLIFIISIILFYQFILNLLKTNYIFYLFFYTKAAITLFEIETIASNYFVVLIIGTMLVIFNYLLNISNLNKIFSLKEKS